MSLALYMDENIRDAIIRGLRRRDVNITTAQEDEMRQRPDPEVLDRASSLNRVVVTEDEDFIIEAARRQQTGEPFSGVIYAPHLLAIGRTVESLELIAMLEEPKDYKGRVVYLPL